MAKPIICTFGGNMACTRQGGSGDYVHPEGYIHSTPSVAELGDPVEDPLEPMGKSEIAADLPGLETFFDEDVSKSILMTDLTQADDVHTMIMKSLYNFDLDSTEGVDRLMSILPIMDPEIMKDIAQEVWPGYVAEEVDPKLLRASLRGYLLDYLDLWEDAEEGISEASEGVA